MYPKEIVDKLKAWQRLKDNGFKFDGWKRDEIYYGDFAITASDQTSCDDKDLDLLFCPKERMSEEDWQELRDLVNNGNKYWTDGGEK